MLRSARINTHCVHDYRGRNRKTASKKRTRTNNEKDFCSFTRGFAGSGQCGRDARGAGGEHAGDHLGYEGQHYQEARQKEQEGSYERPHSGYNAGSGNQVNHKLSLLPSGRWRGTHTGHRPLFCFRPPAAKLVGKHSTQGSGSACGSSSARRESYHGNLWLSRKSQR